MEKSMFLTVKEVAALLNISDSYAYKIMRQLNDELKQKGIITISGRVKQIEEYNQPGWMLPQPQRFMSAKAFRDQIIGLFNKMRATMLKALSKCYEYACEYAFAKRDLDKAYYTVLYQQDTIKEQEEQIEQMTPEAKRYRMLRKFLGPNSTDELLRQAQQKEAQKQRSRSRGRYEER